MAEDGGAATDFFGAGENHHFLGLFWA